MFGFLFIVFMRILSFSNVPECLKARKVPLLMDYTRPLYLPKHVIINISVRFTYSLFLPFYTTKHTFIYSGMLVDELSPGSPEKVCCGKRGSYVSISQQIVSSATGAIVTSLLMTPMDVVKIRLQQQHHPFPKGKCFYFYNGLMEHLCTACENRQPCVWYQRPGNFSGTIDAFVKITREEGIKSLWSGLSPTLVMAVPATVFYYSLYDTLYSNFTR
ncbi:hypothetical protein NECAME_00843, partial [Necator americanus]